jgi:hypothetical protein
VSGEIAVIGLRIDQEAIDLMIPHHLGETATSPFELRWLELPAQGPLSAFT